MVSAKTAVGIPPDRLHRLVTLFAERLDGSFDVDDYRSPSMALWTLER